MDVYDINHRFDYHPPATPGTASKHEMVRAGIKAAALLVVNLVPSGREQSLAVTALEEAMFWANAGIARYQNSPVYKEMAMAPAHNTDEKAVFPYDARERGD